MKSRQRNHNRSLREELAVQRKQADLLYQVVKETQQALRDCERQLLQARMKASMDYRDFLVKSRKKS